MLYNTAERATIKPQMGETERERAEHCRLNGINANRINVLMFLAKCPSCCVQKAQSHAMLYQFAVLLLLIHTQHSGRKCMTYILHFFDCVILMY